MSVDEIMAEARKLPSEDRARLLQDLERGLFAEGWRPSEEPSPELLALLDERDGEYEADPTGGSTVDEVIAFVKRPQS